MMGTGREVLDFDAGQLCADDSGEIDRGRAPARFGDMSGKAVCDLGPDLETARSDVRPDDGPTHLPSRGLETGTQGRDHTACSATPSGVSDADRIVGHQHDSNAVSGEYRQRKPWHFREQSIGWAVVSRLFDVDHVRTVNLINDRPALGDAELETQTMPGVRVTPEIAVSGFGEHGESVDDHP